MLETPVTAAVSAGVALVFRRGGAERDWAAWIVRADTGHVVSSDACIPRNALGIPTIPIPWFVIRLGEFAPK